MVDPTRVLAARPSMLDYQRLQEDFDLKRNAMIANQQMAMAKMASGSNLPAPVQVANRMFQLEQAMSNPELSEQERYEANRQYNLLGQSAKTYGFQSGIEYGAPQMGGFGAQNMQGQFVAPTNQVNAIGGFGDAIGGIAGTKAAYEQGAKNASDFSWKPQTAGAVKLSELEADATGTRNKKSVSANDVLSILAEVDPLLDDATGSYAGAALAAGKPIFGMSDKSTQANAALKVLGGRLVSNIPRMEGPQSDRDVQLYREQAGRIADPTVPADDKRAAIAQIRKLNEKYATPVQQQTKVDPAAIQAEIRRRMGGQ